MANVFERRDDLLDFSGINEALREVTSPLLDLSFVHDFAFVSDFFAHLSLANKSMQGKGHSLFHYEGILRRVLDLVTSLIALASPDEILTPNLYSVRNDLPSLYMRNWHQNLRDFAASLQEKVGPFLMLFEDQKFRFCKNPFDSMVILDPQSWGSAYPEAMQMRRSDAAKAIFRGLAEENLSSFDPVDFWIKPSIKAAFPVVFDVICPILTYFGTTYRCESLFSSLSYIKDKTRNRLKDDALEAYLLLRNEH